MSIQAEKIDHALTPNNSAACPVKLSVEEKEAIDVALKSVEEGRVMSHEVVISKTRKKFPQLHNKFVNEQLIEYDDSLKRELDVLDRSFRDGSAKIYSKAESKQRINTLLGGQF